MDVSGCVGKWKLLAESKALQDERWMTLPEEPNQSKYAQNEAEHGARFFLLDGRKVNAFWAI